MVALVWFLFRKFRVQANPVLLVLHELGALTQPRSPTRQTYQLAPVLDSFS